VPVLSSTSGRTIVPAERDGKAGVPDQCHLERSETKSKDLAGV
jgi:hypothetical protein